MQKYIEIDLLSSTLKRPASKPMICFFIVNNEHSDYFIKKIAQKFVDQETCYNFYGQHEPTWHWIFDVTGMTLYPDSTSETVPLTCGYDDLEEFAEEMYYALKYSDDTEVLLFYDDNEVCVKLKELLALIKKNDV